MTAPRGGPASPLAVSVVIPTARGGTYLREAVDSVLAQSLEDFELIVVADGEDVDLSGLDGVDDRVVVIRQPNRGPSVARNVGIRATRAELVAFLDDDDRMLPERLRVQVDAMVDRADIGLCHTQFTVIYGEGAPAGSGDDVQVGFASDVQYIDLLRGQAHVLLPASMLRKRLLEEVGMFDASMRLGEDLDVIYRMARESRLAFLPEVHTEYRRHGANASGDIRKDAQTLAALLTKLRRLELSSGRAAEVEATHEGLVWARKYEAAGALGELGEAWGQRDIPAVATSLFERSFQFAVSVVRRPGG